MRISFAVTAYQETSRGGPTIMDCIAAAVAHPAIDEIVVVDDASADYERLKHRLADTPKVQIFQNEENLGVFGNKLSAVAHTTGHWVINSDSDNVFDKAAIDAVLERNLDVHTWYCPSFAKPKFDYRAYIGRYDLGNVSELIRAGGLAHCFVNTGNQTVNRQAYMEVFGKYLNQRADLMFPNYLGIKEEKRQDHRWREVFNACDSLVFNAEWLRNGGALEIVDGFEYEHYWTGGPDSNYNRAPSEKGRLNEELLAGLLEDSEKERGRG